MIEEGLEDQRGCDLIDNAAVLLTGVAGLVEHLVSFMGCQAFIPQVDGKVCQLAQCSRKSLRLKGLRAFFPRQPERVSHHDTGNIELARQPA